MRCDGPLSLSLYLYISQPSGLTDADAEEGMQIVCVHDDVCVISLSSHSNTTSTNITTTNLFSVCLHFQLVRVWLASQR